MGQSRVITIKVNEIPVKLTIDADKEELYRRAESALRELFIKMADALGNTNNVQVLSHVAYELMIKKLKLQDEIQAMEQKIDQVLSKESEI